MSFDPYASPAAPDAAPALHASLPMVQAPVVRDGAARPPTLALLREQVPVLERTLHAGDVIYHRGQAFGPLHVLHAGSAKLVGGAVDGREQVLGLRFGNDWLGLDGIATGRYRCDAVAMDTSQLWTLSYAALLRAAARTPALLRLLHTEMSHEIVRDRDTLLSLVVLPATARVAGFLHQWADSLAQRGLRTDTITLRLSRAEIGNHLGLTLSTVSRAMTTIERAGLIHLSARGRDIAIPDAAALGDYAHRTSEE